MPENPSPQRLMLTPGVHARLTEINRLEPEMAALSDDELRRKTDALKAQMRAGTPRVGGSLPTMNVRTLIEVVEQHRAGRDFWAVLGEFLDEFYAAAGDRRSTIEQEPATDG